MRDGALFVGRDFEPARAIFSRRAPLWLDQFRQLLSFPSVSSSAARRGAMRDCALWLRSELQRLGAENARLARARHHPTVLGRISGPPGAPRVLIYGHYDVQPAESLAEWRSPPFRPTLRDGFVYARGASDDKGQLFAHLKAVELLQAVLGQLPVTVSFVIDGEEEIGSPGLARALSAASAELESDVAVVSDMPVLAPDRPSLTYALRGDLYLDVEVSGPSGDLHSGNFGGAVQNALSALVDALSRLHRADGTVAASGFYDDVLSVSRSERAYMRRVGPKSADVRHEAGGAALAGESGYSAYERSTIRPSLEISGVRGGYGGRGVKGVIPAHAVAKLDIRLVPRQDPDRIHRGVFELLARRLPAGMRLRTRERMRVPPVVLNRNHPAQRAACRAYRRAFGKAPVFTRLGGSIPVVSLLANRLRLPTVLLGLALPQDAAHAENERFSLAMLERGIWTSAALLQELAAP